MGFNVYLCWQLTKYCLTICLYLLNYVAISFGIYFYLFHIIPRLWEGLHIRLGVSPTAPGMVYWTQWSLTKICLLIWYFSQVLHGSEFMILSTLGGNTATSTQATWLMTRCPQVGKCMGTVISTSKLARPTNQEPTVGVGLIAAPQCRDWPHIVHRPLLSAVRT